MQALTVVPGDPATAGVSTVPAPSAGHRELLIEAVLVGLCGTDREILNRSPKDTRQLIIGHESLGRVVSAPVESGFKVGNLVVGVIRRPCERRCVDCSRGRYDKCSSTSVGERGILGLQGFGCELWTSEPEYLVDATVLGERGVLVEPASSVIKGVGRLTGIIYDTAFALERALVLGAGTIGLLTAFVLAERGIEVHLVEPRGGIQRGHLAAAVATRVYQSCGEVRQQMDCVVDCTASPTAILGATQTLRNSGRVLALGIPSGEGGPVTEVASALRYVVLHDIVTIGSVNASVSDYRVAAETLARAPEDWLQDLITHRVRPESWVDGLQLADDRIKTVVSFD